MGNGRSYAAPAGTVRAPLQERSRASLERLLDAAEALFAEKGYDDATIQAIARRARRSVGAVYTRFADKRTLFLTVQERFFVRLLADWEMAVAPARWEDADLATVVAGVVQTFAGYAQRHGGFIRAFAVRAITDADVRVRALAGSQALAARLAPLLLARRGAIAHPDPAFAVDFGFRVVFATLQQLVLYAGDVPTARVVPLERMAGELTRVYLAYLTASPGRG